LCVSFWCLNVAKTSPGAMVPAMFSTSVLERRKSLDPGAMLRDLEASEAIFVDKENRPPKADGAKDVKVKDLGDWWLQQRRVDELQQQSLEERRFSRGAKSQWQRCEDLEAESQAQAKELSQLKDQLKREEEQRKAQAERFQLILKGSEAVDRLAGLQKLQEQMQKLQEKSSMQEEQLEALTRRPKKDAEQRSLRSLCTQTDAEESEAVVQLQEELKTVKAEAEVRTKCYRQVQEELQRECDSWQRRAQALEVVPKSEGCKACESLLAEGRELSSTVAMLKEQCENLEVENQSLRSKVDSLQENLEYVSSSHAELAGHANHRQKIRHTIQLKTDRDNTREENFRLKQRIRQLEAGRNSQGIINAVAGFAGATSDPKTPTASQRSKSGFRQPRFSGLETNRDAKEMMKIQQLEHQLERNRNNVMHFLVLIERAVAKGDGASDAATLLGALRSRFLS